MNKSELQRIYNYAIHPGVSKIQIKDLSTSSMVVWVALNGLV